MKAKNIIIVTVFMLAALFSNAQIPDKEAINNLIEDIAESSDEELDYTQLYEDLYYYAQNPLNLNTATREDLEKIQFLNDFQIEDILEYRRTAGEMKTIYELQMLESFSAEDIRNILPFVTVAPESKQSIPEIKDILHYGKNTLFLRTQFLLQQQKGYTDEVDIDKQYLGNRLKYYTRYQFQYKQKLKFGFTAEKDPGEAFFGTYEKQGFDYYSAHFEAKNIGKFKVITLGDYQVRFGQGLIAWTGLTQGKSSYVMSIKKKYDGLRKYSSTDENKFMRGAGATVKLGETEITGFTSFKYIDGNIDLTDTTDTETEIESITSFQTTGLHRSISELQDKHSVSEFIYGGNVNWRHKSFRIGASFIQYFFGSELNKDIRPYNMFDFRGDNGLNASIDYQYSFKNFYFFGEEAIDKNGAAAFLNSVQVKLAPQFSLALLHRNYAKNYTAYYAAGFGEQSKTSNEKGMYFGTEMHPVRKLTVSAYFDAYSFPWLKFGTYAPSEGVDIFTQANYDFNRYINAYIRYKQETKYRNSSYDYTGAVPVIPAEKKQLRFHINYRLSKNLILKNRIEYAQYETPETETENGWMIFQDINYMLPAFPLKINARIAFFDASYNARIYAYENDILYGYSIPAYSGQGIRTYLTLKYTVIKDFIDIWLRFANFAYADRDVIGSGYDEIQGSNKSEVKFQIRFKF
ncbi:MAG: helix-hairpin-helix domain-containing protein [Chlorobi bacterium]|nr:helix-hairpin-helix domain-containing protein [Chlorobiota bacterium]